MEDFKILIVKTVVKTFVINFFLVLLLSCSSKRVENSIVQSSIQIQNSSQKGSLLSKDVKNSSKAKIDVYEIENRYHDKTTSFSLRNGWQVEIFEPQILDSYTFEEQEEDKEIYEIDKVFSDILTQDNFPDLLTKFRDWFVDGYGRYNIPVEINQYVEYYIYLFTETKFRQHYEKWLSRYFLYSGIIRKILVSYGMPDDLVFVAMAESGFSNRAVSPMGAVGPWQFIYGTGVRYGLRIDEWIDERRDIILSTIAAINYLKDLYDMFGDWYLAWAAYNAGERRIEKAIKRVRSKNFWDLLKKRAIPRETAGYVPKIIALSIITKNLEKFGFKKEDYYQTPIEMEQVVVPFQIDIFSIARLCNCSVEDVYNMNPHLKHPVTPPYETRLNVPKGSAKSLQEKINFISENFITEYNKYYNLGFYPVANEVFSKKVIAGVLHIKTKKEIHNTLLDDFFDVSDEFDDSEFIAPADETIKIPIEVYVREFITYRIKKKDSIFKISSRFGVKVQDILKMNNLASIKSIKPGMVIKIPTSSVAYRRDDTKRNNPVQKVSTRRTPGSKNNSMVVHVVKRGETLSHISKKYGVDEQRIKKVNRMKSSKLYQGQKIYIPVRAL
ncbi:MAG: LysM peptidoglycan-binding domain-containing protein [Candidatus Calescibacterium sp.]|nr:LysM peptidoglycan-binding domain-containing protein [Candidatus Calescibacterium sp.]